MRYDTFEEVDQSLLKLREELKSDDPEIVRHATARRDYEFERVRNYIQYAEQRLLFIELSRPRNSRHTH